MAIFFLQYLFHYLQNLLISAVGGHKIDSIHHAFGLLKQFLGYFHSLLGSLFTGSLHPLPELSRNIDTGNFVLQKFGMFIAMERQDSQHHRNRYLPYEFEKA